VFGATASGDVSATAPCPALKRDQEVETAVAEKLSRDDAKVAELVASGVKPIRLVYQDGGQNPAFAGYKDSSDPEALASGPQEIVMGEPAKPAPAVVRFASVDSARLRVADAAVAQAAAKTVVAPTADAVAATPQEKSGGILGVWGAGTQNVKKWLNLGGQEPAQPTVTAFVPEQPIPTDAPLPPRRDGADVAGEKALHFASLHAPPKPPTKPNLSETAPDKPKSSEAATTSSLSVAPSQ
jgi:hypothetical protein